MDPSFRIRGHELRSDWAGEKETRNSSGAVVGSWDDTFQKHIPENKRSSPKAVQKQNCMQKHWECMMCDLSFAVKPVLMIVDMESA